MNNFELTRYLLILSPFMGAHFASVILTYAFFKFQKKKDLLTPSLPLWKLGPLVFIVMNIIQMFFEYWYLSSRPGERLDFRLSTDIIIGWSAFFGMMTFYISARETRKILLAKKGFEEKDLKIRLRKNNLIGVCVCTIGLLISVFLLTLVNSSIVDFMRLKITMHHFALLLSGVILYSFFMWGLEKQMRPENC